jgi:hypothetical protein
MKAIWAIRLTFIAIALVGGVSKVTAQENTPSIVEPITSAAIAQVIKQGKMLYDYDQAAWHSTDALLEQAAPETLPLAGRIVIPVEGGLQAIYFGKKESGRFAIFTALWNGKKLVDPVFSKGNNGPALSADANAFADVYDLLNSDVIKQDTLWFCNKAQPNIVILPGDGVGEFSLYYMTPQVDLKSYPMGGHHRIDIKNGVVTANRSFTKGCINLDVDKKDKPVGFFITHLLDPIPTEIHVFSAIASNTPIYVGAGEKGQTWAITPNNGNADIAAITLTEK